MITQYFSLTEQLLSILVCVLYMQFPTLNKNPSKQKGISKTPTYLIDTLIVINWAGTLTVGHPSTLLPSEPKEKLIKNGNLLPLYGLPLQREIYAMQVCFTNICWWKGASETEETPLLTEPSACYCEVWTLLHHFLWICSLSPLSWSLLCLQNVSLDPCSPCLARLIFCLLTVICLSLKLCPTDTV